MLKIRQLWAKSILLITFQYYFLYFRLTTCSDPVQPAGHNATHIKCQILTYPYLVGVRSQIGIYTTEKLQLCTGVILSRWWTLTAAHCVFEESIKDRMTNVVAGTNYSVTAVMNNVLERERDNTTQPLENSEYLQVKSVVELVAHARYKERPDRCQFDLALLRVDTPFEITAAVRPAHLPSEGDTHKCEKFRVMGWALSKAGTPADITNVISCHTAELANLKTCRKEHHGKQVGIENICVVQDEEDGKDDICRIDGGGPLVCLDFVDRLDVVIGIASKFEAVNCTTETSIFVRLESYVNWIKKTYMEPPEIKNVQGGTLGNKIDKVIFVVMLFYLLV